MSIFNRKPVQFPIDSKVYLTNQAQYEEWTVTAIDGRFRRIEHHQSADTYCIAWYAVEELADAS